VLAVFLVRDAPAGHRAPAPSAPALRGTRAQLREVWGRRETRLGFFGHLGTQFPMMVFTLLWGVPYLETAQHLSLSAAGALLTLFVGCTICIGPVLGMLTARHPTRRSWLLLAVIAANALTWTAVLASQGPAPRWLLLLLVVALSACGPGSVVGFDIARTANPHHSLGVAQSMVNTAGFLATLFVLAMMAEVMTAMGGFTPQAFRVAWLVQYPVWAVSVIGILVTRRQPRRNDSATLDSPRGVGKNSVTGAI
jgi:MFS family permease